MLRLRLNNQLDSRVNDPVAAATADQRTQTPDRPSMKLQEVWSPLSSEQLKKTNVVLLKDDASHTCLQNERVGGVVQANAVESCSAPITDAAAFDFAATKMCSAAALK